MTEASLIETLKLTGKTDKCIASESNMQMHQNKYILFTKAGFGSANDTSSLQTKFKKVVEKAQYY